MQGYGKAYTNIALIKYWGKKDQKLMLPMNNSLSLTLDAFYTETTITFSDTFKEDTFYLNGTQVTNLKKVLQLVNYARGKKGINLPFRIDSTNHVPTAAGLASSASGMAALAGAVSEALQLPTDGKSLSILARHGSGSASRSIYGGFVEWEQGYDDTSSYATPITEDLSHWPLAMVFLIINGAPKEVSSGEGMQRTVATSPFYEGWLKSLPEDLKAMKQAIKDTDFLTLGAVAERNALKMHATNLGANPPFSYFAPDTIKGMDFVRNLRKTGLPCYFTMDAGPNVKILVEEKNLNTLLIEVKKAFPNNEIVVAFPGKGIQTKRSF